MNKRFLSLGITFLVVTAITSQGRRDSIQPRQLDEVVVSDSRFHLKREQSGKTVIKISSEELERNQGKSVAEIINSESGIEIAGNRGRQGEILGVFARGGRGRQVLVLVDGVRVSDPSSFSQEYDLRLLTTSNIESIEIIKGAASTLYGTNAATAVINITTKKSSEKKIAGSFQSSVGTNQTAEDQNYDLSNFTNSSRLSGTISRLTYAAAFSSSFTDGLSSIITPENETDTFSRINTDVRLGYEISDNFKFGIYGNQTKLNTEYDESFGLADAPYRFLSEQNRLGVSSTYLYNKGELGLNLAYTDHASENRSAFPGTFEGSNYVLDVFNKYTFNNSFYTVIGLNYIDDRTVFAETKKFTLMDQYVNMVYISSIGLNINTGFRLNNHSAYGSHFVYSINPSYTINTSMGYLKVLASYATSYITPSLTQLFGDFGANPNLEPETDRSIEVGLEYAKTKKLRCSLLYFNRREENFVFFDNNSFLYGNADNTINAQGVEIELNWHPLEALRLNTNYTFTERMGDNAIRIPKHKLNASVGYSFSGETFTSLSYAYTGKRFDTDFNAFSDTDLDPFSLLGFYISHEAIPDRLRLFLNVDNLANTSYVEVIGFSTRGRNIRLGLNLSL